MTGSGSSRDIKTIIKEAYDDEAWKPSRTFLDKALVAYEQVVRDAATRQYPLTATTWPMSHEDRARIAQLRRDYVWTRWAGAAAIFIMLGASLTTILVAFGSNSIETRPSLVAGTALSSLVVLAYVAQTWRLAGSVRAFDASTARKSPEGFVGLFTEPLEVNRRAQDLVQRAQHEIMTIGLWVGRNDTSSGVEEVINDWIGLPNRKLTSVYHCLPTAWPKCRDLLDMRVHLPNTSQRICLASPLELDVLLSENELLVSLVGRNRTKLAFHVEDPSTVAEVWKDLGGEFLPHGRGTQSFEITSPQDIKTIERDVTCRYGLDGLSINLCDQAGVRQSPS